MANIKITEDFEGFTIASSYSQRYQEYIVSIPILAKPVQDNATSIPNPLPIHRGGTGGKTVQEALYNLGITGNTLPQARNGDVLVFNSVSNQWEARNLSEAGGTVDSSGFPTTEPAGGSLDLDAGLF